MATDTWKDLVAQMVAEDDAAHARHLAVLQKIRGSFADCKEADQWEIWGREYGAQLIQMASTLLTGHQQISAQRNTLWEELENLNDLIAKDFKG